MPHRSIPLLHNWKAKLGSLALAIVLWLVIHESINHATPPVTPSAASAEAVPKE